MFKLVLLFAIAAVVAAKPGVFLGSHLSEQTIESHGHSIIHGSAVVPVVAAAPAAIAYSTPVHASVPLIEPFTFAAAPVHHVKLHHNIGLLPPHIV